MNSYLLSVLKQFKYYKKLADQSFDRLSEDEMLWQYNAESNSIAMIICHVSGNMKSRFTDFLISDGEKPWRNRDEEFVNKLVTKQHLLDVWDQGWACLFEAIEQLQANDLEKIVYIRNEGHTVVEAINRQLAHYPYHIGQIVFVAKMLRNEDWKTLSIARNKSSDYNSQKFGQTKGKRHFTDGL